MPGYFKLLLNPFTHGVDRPLIKINYERYVLDGYLPVLRRKISLWGYHALFVSQFELLN
jgi:hypothetical protein